MQLDDDARVFEKIVRLASPSDITSVYVAGKQVSGTWVDTGGPQFRSASRLT